METWKDIIGYEKLYQISNLGNVKSLSREFVQPDRMGELFVNRTREKILIPNLGKRGYWCISLTKNAIRKQYTIHRLIAIAFIPNLENKPFVNHINRIRTDNRIENLEWCTNKENVIHGYKNNPDRKTISKPINQLTINGEFIKRWDSISLAGKTLGLHIGEICGVCRKRFRDGYVLSQHGGFKWEYST